MTRRGRCDLRVVDWTNFATTRMRSAYSARILRRVIFINNIRHNLEEKERGRWSVTCFPRGTPPYSRRWRTELPLAHFRQILYFSAKQESPPSCRNVLFLRGRHHVHSLMHFYSSAIFFPRKRNVHSEIILRYTCRVRFTFTSAGNVPDQFISGVIEEINIAKASFVANWTPKIRCTLDMLDLFIRYFQFRIKLSFDIIKKFIFNLFAILSMRKRLLTALIYVTAYSQATATHVCSFKTLYCYYNTSYRTLRNIHYLLRKIREAIMNMLWHITGGIYTVFLVLPW